MMIVPRGREVASTNSPRTRATKKNKKQIVVIQLIRAHFCTSNTVMLSNCNFGNVSVISQKITSGPQHLFIGHIHAARPWPKWYELKQWIPPSAPWKDFQWKWFLTELWLFGCPFLAFVKFAKAGHLKLDASPIVEFKKELLGYEPKVSWCCWPMLARLIHLLSPLTAVEGHRERVQLLLRVPGTMGWDGWAGNGGGCHGSWLRAMVDAC